ncbi:MAG: hypothetical protein ABJD53_08105 [Gammaproteobacteria bacterium]
MSAHEPDEAMQRLLDRTLRELPLRGAPATLESRVFSELERRAVRPWWRRSFTHWPAPAKVAFLVFCGALVALVFACGTAAVTNLRFLLESGTPSLSWARQIGVLIVSAGNLFALLARTLPVTWLYQGIAVCAVLYAVLFGLGAAVYRTLYLHQPLDGK